MIKLNKKLLTILILCFLAISSVALGFLFPEIKSDRVDAETTYNEYGLSVTEGASVRTTVDSVGIRFFGNYSSEALTSNHKRRCKARYDYST